MKYFIRLFFSNQISNSVRVQQVRLNGFLSRLNVNSNDLAAVLFQFPSQILPDKAFAAGDQRFHAFPSASRLASFRSCSAMMAQSCS